MAFHHQGGGPPFPTPFQQPQNRSSSQQSPSTGMRGFPPDMNAPNPFFPVQGPHFDITEWYPQFQSCVWYFLDHAQHSGPVQALAAFINIRLPFQRSQNALISSNPAGSPPAVPSPSSRAAGKLPMPNRPPMPVSLTPYIRRLIATGFDFPGVLHGFFGDDWPAGIGPLHEAERRNYLFATKAGNWLEVKQQYDMQDDQSVPYLKPLQNVTESEIVTAEANWSEWLAMQDWMVGPRSPEAEHPIPVVVKKEEI
ncbi:hypothetical protein F4778DRAFT_46579 [Xylariomycetidae sp. FL2044]|nr:hypothetical protein F4778DRAFT_693529 [Xylariomycetidae sp. FL2044]KAH9904802.1 hypothetical protein F4778DRAFT_46579 [Xylariomycetidae sp. FL2044]